MFYVKYLEARSRTTIRAVSIRNEDSDRRASTSFEPACDLFPVVSNGNAFIYDLDTRLPFLPDMICKALMVIHFELGMRC